MKHNFPTNRFPSVVIGCGLILAFDPQTGQMLGFRGHLVSGIVSQIIGSLRATIVVMCQSIRGSGAIFRQRYFAYRNWFSRGQVHTGESAIRSRCLLKKKHRPSLSVLLAFITVSFFFELSPVESADEFGIKASWHRHFWNIHQSECIASLFAQSSSGPGPLVLNNGKSIKILKKYIQCSAIRGMPPRSSSGAISRKKDRIEKCSIFKWMFFLAERFQLLVTHQPAQVTRVGGTVLWEEGVGVQQVAEG